MFSVRQSDRPLPGDETPLLYNNEDVLTTPGNDEQEALIQHNHPSNSWIDSLAPPRLLVLIGPALLTGIIGKAFDVAFLSNSYVRIASELNHYKDATWMHVTASICSALFIPLHTHLLRCFGIRRAMLVAFFCFALGTGLSGLSTSYWQILSSRYVIGLGSSGIGLLSMIVINDIVGVKQLAIWESFVICIEMGASMAAGPLSGWISTKYTWHSVFYLEFTFAAIGFIILYLSFAKVSSHLEYSDSILLKKGDSHAPPIDIVGWVLLVLAVAIPVISLTLGDNFLKWTDPAEIVLLISGPIFLFLFVGFETKFATTTVLDITPILQPSFIRVLLQVFGYTLILNSIIFTIPPYIQVRAFDGSPFQDWALTCIFLGFPLGSIFGGYLIKHEVFLVQRIMLVNSVILQCVCALFFARVIKPESSTSSPFLFGFGLSAGFCQSCLLYATLSSVEKQWWSQTLASFCLLETFGADLGMALTSMITRVVSKSNVRSSLGNSEATEKILSDAMQDLQTIRELDPRSRDLILGSFENAMHRSFLLPCLTAIVVIASAVCMNIWPPRSQYGELTGQDYEDQEA